MRTLFCLAIFFTFNAVAAPAYYRGAVTIKMGEKKYPYMAIFKVNDPAADGSVLHELTTTIKMRKDLSVKFAFSYVRKGAVMEEVIYNQDKEYARGVVSGTPFSKWSVTRKIVNCPPNDLKCAYTETQESVLTPKSFAFALQRLRNSTRVFAMTGEFKPQTAQEYDKAMAQIEAIK